MTLCSILLGPGMEHIKQHVITEDSFCCPVFPPLITQLCSWCSMSCQSHPFLAFGMFCFVLFCSFIFKLSHLPDPLHQGLQCSLHVPLGQWQGSSSTRHMPTLCTQRRVCASRCQSHFTSSDRQLKFKLSFEDLTHMPSQRQLTTGRLKELVRRNMWMQGWSKGHKLTKRLQNLPN